ncbi:hypothetical protein XHV734_1311 [Xanthomonas hortorum pv. vitians]|nr:hypothetical protein XHV734_1311 [Xanthomonas hortorum pv. vitians]
MTIRPGQSGACAFQDMAAAVVALAASATTLLPINSPVRHTATHTRESERDTDAAVSVLLRNTALMRGKSRSDAEVS